MKLSILIVDDTKFLRLMLGDILRKAGHEVIAEAENGEIGVQLFREFKPNLVILDLTMPVMDGITTLREIRKIQPDSLVIICSAMSQRDLISEAIDAGANGYIMKPFEPDRVKQAIEQIMDKVEKVVASSIHSTSVLEIEPEIEIENEPEIETENEPEIEIEEQIEITESSEHVEMESYHSDLVLHLKPFTEENPYESLLNQSLFAEEDISIQEEEVREEVEEVEDVKIIEEKMEAKEFKEELIQPLYMQQPDPEYSVVKLRRNMNRFHSSIMCNWEENVEDNKTNYFVIHTEVSNSLRIEMMNENEQKQSVVFSVDGFSYLVDWLEDKGVITRNSLV